jgi:hypothetical protein
VESEIFYVAIGRAAWENKLTKRVIVNGLNSCPKNKEYEI